MKKHLQTLIFGLLIMQLPACSITDAISDIPQKIRFARIDHAGELEEAGKYREAAEAFKALGSQRDRYLYWRAAVNWAAAGDYNKAVDLKKKYYNDDYFCAVADWFHHLNRTSEMQTELNGVMDRVRKEKPQPVVQSTSVNWPDEYEVILSECVNLYRESGQPQKALELAVSSFQNSSPREYGDVREHFQRASLLKKCSVTGMPGCILALAEELGRKDLVVQYTKEAKVYKEIDNARKTGNLSKDNAKLAAWAEAQGATITAAKFRLLAQADAEKQRLAQKKAEEDARQAEEDARQAKVDAANRAAREERAQAQAAREQEILMGVIQGLEAVAAIAASSSSSHSGGYSSGYQHTTPYTTPSYSAGSSASSQAVVATLTELASSLSSSTSSQASSTTPTAASNSSSYSADTSGSYVLQQPQIPLPDVLVQQASCSGSLSFLTPKLRAYQDPILDEIRREILSSSVQQTISAAKSQGFTKQAAIQALQQQAEAHNKTADEAARAANQTDGGGNEKTIGLARADQLPLSFSCTAMGANVHTASVCTYINNRWGSLGTRANIAMFEKCW